MNAPETMADEQFERHALEVLRRAPRVGGLARVVCRPRAIDVVSGP